MVWAMEPEKVLDKAAHEDRLTKDELEYVKPRIVEETEDTEG